MWAANIIQIDFSSQQKTVAVISFYQLLCSFLDLFLSLPLQINIVDRRKLLSRKGLEHISLAGYKI